MSRSDSDEPSVAFLPAVWAILRKDLQIEKLTHRKFLHFVESTNIFSMSSSQL